MRKFLTISCLVLVAVAILGGSILFARSPFPNVRQFELTYSGVISEFPKDAKSLRVWVPLASDREGQKILKREIETPAPFEITKDPVYGNEIAYFELNAPFPKEAEFTVRYKARISKQDFKKKAKKDNRSELYLKPSKLMIVDDEVHIRSQEATSSNMSTVENAEGIYNSVILKMKYDKNTPGWGAGDTKRACALGKGNCTDFHSLFISMSQAAHIPARFKIGFTIPEKSGPIKGYHCWAEFYDSAKGWHPVDASEAWKHPELKDIYFGNFDTNKFVISMGRDIDLIPDTSHGPVNIFFYPHAEANGEKFDGIETYYEFENN